MAEFYKRVVFVTLQHLFDVHVMPLEKGDEPREMLNKVPFLLIAFILLILFSLSPTCLVALEAMLKAIHIMVKNYLSMRQHVQSKIPCDLFFLVKFSHPCVSV